MKRAFTLAETLITLGIVGVVVAITIPTLIANYQKQVFANKLAQTYSILNQAIDMAITEHGEPKNWEWDEKYDSGIRDIKWVNKYLYPYLKGQKIPGEQRLPTQYVYTYETLDGTEYNGTGRIHVEYVMNNGTVLTSRGGGYDWSDDPWVWLEIDLNGKNGPNVKGKDIFNLFFYSEKRFHSAYWVSWHKEIEHFSRDEAMEVCRTNYIATYCFDLIMQNSWKFPKDYPW